MTSSFRSFVNCGCFCLVTIGRVSTLDRACRRINHLDAKDKIETDRCGYRMWSILICDSEADLEAAVFVLALSHDFRQDVCLLHTVLMQRTAPLLFFFLDKGEIKEMTNNRKKYVYLASELGSTEKTQLWMQLSRSGGAAFQDEGFGDVLARVDHKQACI